MRRILVIAFALLLAACSRGPDADRLQADLQARLDQVFGADNLQIVELARRGSASDAQAPQGEQQRILYFDATLRLNQARDLRSWDSPGIASLISLTGAGPRGVQGLSGQDSQSGEQLKVHGSLIYRRQGENWAVLAPQGFSPAPAPSLAEDGPQQRRERLIGAISTALNLAPQGSSPQQSEIIREEVNQALASIQGRLSRQQNGFALAAGHPGGQYSRFAKAYAELVRGQGLNMTPLTTQGGVENLELLRAGETSLALSQSDLAHAALTASGPFAGQAPLSQLRALASLYPEPVHVIVLKGGPGSLRALAGKRVNLGPRGAASRDTAQAVLAAHGLEQARLQVAELELIDALKALRDGELDAIVQVIGAPADAIRAAGEELDLRLLPLDPAAVARLVAERPGSFALALPSGTYAGQIKPVPTLAVSSLLLTEQAFSQSEARQLVQLLFASGNQWLAAGSVQGAQLAPGNARRGLSVPLHEGALQALQVLQQPADEARGSN